MKMNYLLTCMFVMTGAFANQAHAERPNVLFIAVDDLRVELGCYGQEHVKTPHIDSLAAESTLFERAYCQQTVCNPSRASLLTGRRPDTLRVWDLPTHFREHHPDIVTLPQLFKENGYQTECVGKIFHNWRQDQWKGDPASWSVPSVLHYNSHGNDQPIVEGKVPPNLASGKRGIECRDVPDDAYFDGRVAKTAVQRLQKLAAESDPFFLAVGFWKPHTPFNAPKKYWDLYDRESIPLPQRLSPPENVPEIALTKDRYRDDESDLREMHHGHLAAISYLDAQVGKVLGALEELKLQENTIVVFWSDHGLHLGEHGLLRKTTLFELDAHVPLLISAPGFKRGQKSDQLVELLDLYPTLAELAKLAPPSELEGKSQVPVLQNPQTAIHHAALTQSPRPNYPRGKKPEVMGYSIRSDKFRYTEWRDFQTGRVQARELYDHRKDALETDNVAEDENFANEVAQLEKQLEAKLNASTEHVIDPTSTLMLDLPKTGSDPTKIDYQSLPRVPSKHAMISDVRARGGDWVHQHAYLAHFEGRYWAMWSDGPGKRRKNLSAKQHYNVVPGHDLPDTRVSYATSHDGLNWSEPATLSGPPRTPGFGWIARGFWVRDGQLLALASHFNAPAYPGKGLSLEAFRWDEETESWGAHGTVRDDSLNNFPPKKLPSGEYLMTRRDHRQQVSVLVGGERAFNEWEVFPLAAYNAAGRPEEPYWYLLPDEKTIVGLIRDNGRSGRLLRTFSMDNGRSWTPIVKTNFPDATSKFFVYRTSRGDYVLVSNSNPKRRDPLTLAVSKDGLVYHDLFYLIGGRHIDYPHIIEHDDHLIIAFSGAKQTMEVLRISLDELDSLMQK